MVDYADRVSRKGLTAREAAKRAGMSPRTAQRWTSQPRAQWIAEKAAEREEAERKAREASEPPLFEVS